MGRNPKEIFLFPQKGYLSGFPQTSKDSKFNECRGFITEQKLVHKGIHVHVHVNRQSY